VGLVLEDETNVERQKIVEDSRREEDTTAKEEEVKKRWN